MVFCSSTTCRSFSSSTLGTLLRTRLLVVCDVEAKFCSAGFDDAFVCGVEARCRDSNAGIGPTVIASGAGVHCNSIHCWRSAFKVASFVFSSCILARLAMFRGFGFSTLGGSGTSSYFALLASFRIEVLRNLNLTLENQSDSSAISALLPRLSSRTTRGVVAAFVVPECLHLIVRQRA